jgi:hypothetical protein
MLAVKSIQKEGGRRNNRREKSNVNLSSEKNKLGRVLLCFPRKKKKRGKKRRRTPIKVLELTRISFYKSKIVKCLENGKNNSLAFDLFDIVHRFECKIRSNLEWRNCFHTVFTNIFI